MVLEEEVEQVGFHAPSRKIKCFLLYFLIENVYHCVSQENKSNRKFAKIAVFFKNFRSNGFLRF